MIPVDKTNALTKKHRDPLMDILKCFAIILVIWGHSILHLTSRYAATTSYENPAFAFIYLFHMPLFMIVSGFFAKGHSNESTLWRIVVEKSRQLLVPSIFAAVMLWLWMLFTGERFPKEYYLIGGLWFLKSLFICAVLYYVATMFKMKNLAIIISLIISQGINFVNVSWMYPCFLFGTMLRGLLPGFRKYRTIILPLSGFLFLILFFLFESDLVRIPQLGETLKHFFQGDFSKSNELILKRVYRLLAGISGSMFFILVFDIFASSLANMKIGMSLMRIGSVTLGIYILQTFILEWFLRVVICFDEVNIWIYNLVITPIISAAVLMLCLFILKYVEHSKIARRLIMGKWK